MDGTDDETAGTNDAEEDDAEAADAGTDTRERRERIGARPQRQQVQPTPQEPAAFRIGCDKNESLLVSAKKGEWWCMLGEAELMEAQNESVKQNHTTPMSICA